MRWQLFLACAFTVGIYHTASGQIYEVGDRVMVKRWYVNLAEDGKDLNTRVQLGDIFKVSKVEGHALWVGAGWIQDEDVVSVDEAINFFSKRIKKSPFDSSCYHNRALAYLSLEQFDNARIDEEVAIGLSPNPAYYNTLGTIWEAKKDYDRAIAAFDEAIRLYPLDPTPYQNRGKAWSRKEEYDKAIADFSESMRLDPKYTFSIHERGFAWAIIGRYDKAIADFNTAIQIDSKDSASYSGLAWIWATCPDKKYRDGARAVEFATKACEIDNWQFANRLDTLAAAYAEQGDFESAVKWETKATEMKLPEWTYKTPEDLEKRLEIFKAGKPFRDEPKQ
jgi:tetratricopeptide (TPR) repeat protein